MFLLFLDVKFFLFSSALQGRIKDGTIHAQTIFGSIWSHITCSFFFWMLNSFFPLVFSKEELKTELLPVHDLVWKKEPESLSFRRPVNSKLLQKTVSLALVLLIH